MDATSTPQLPCLCANFRRAARALTLAYEDALRPLGIEATQFTILQALSFTGEIRQRELSRILAADSTTLTRTLELMASHGWIVKRPGKDKRERFLRLTARGETQLKRGTVPWQKVQTQLRRKFGEETWAQLFEVTNHVTKIAIDSGGSS
jgi:DNA-binding MarR family transcriptional regulator